MLVKHADVCYNPEKTKQILSISLITSTLITHKKKKYHKNVQKESMQTVTQLS